MARRRGGGFEKGRVEGGGPNFVFNSIFFTYAFLRITLLRLCRVFWGLVGCSHMFSAVLVFSRGFWGLLKCSRLFSAFLAISSLIGCYALVFGFFYCSSVLASCGLLSGLLKLSRSS